MFLQRADDLDFGGLLRKAIDAHTRAILVRFQAQLARGPMHSAFSKPGDVQLVEDGTAPCTSLPAYAKALLEEGSMALRVRLCADEVVVVGLDSRTGRIGLRDTGNLGAAGRGPRFATVSERVNENPAMLTEVLTRLRLNVRVFGFPTAACSSALTIVVYCRRSGTWQSKRRAILACGPSGFGTSHAKV